MMIRCKAAAAKNIDRPKTSSMKNSGHGAEVSRGAQVINEVEWFGIGTDANRVTLGTDDGHSDGAVAADDEHDEHSSRFSIPIGTLVDGQSVMLLFVVTFISSLVHIYSTDYVNGDRRYTHYYAFDS